MPVAVLRSKFAEVSKKFLDLLAANVDGGSTALVKSVFIQSSSLVKGNLYQNAQSELFLLHDILHTSSQLLYSLVYPFISDCFILVFSKKQLLNNNVWTNFWNSLIHEVFFMFGFTLNILCNACWKLGKILFIKLFKYPVIMLMLILNIGKNWLVKT